MPRVWNIGNTTVRNPKRIENALRVFSEEGFSGNAKGSILEASLHGKLKEREVLEFVGPPSDWNGRKWRAAFYQLGFISYESYRINGITKSTKELFSEIGLPGITENYQVTLAGEKLIGSIKTPEIEEVYLRQFVCYELPNSLESGFPQGKMKPFILFLEVLLLLQKSNLAGLTKLETGLFLQKFRDHTNLLASEIVNEIIEWRTLKRNCKNRKQLKILKNKYVADLRAFSGINPLSIISDYADTTFRYFSLSGLFSLDGETIIIRNNKVEFVTKLLEFEPNFLFSANPIEYFRHFYSNSYTIPSDIKEFALKEIDILKSEIRDRSIELFIQADLLNSDSDLNEIQAFRHKLVEYIRWEKEEDYATEQQSDEAVMEILSYLKALNQQGGLNSPEIDDRPAFLEWAVWRSFLAIDQIVSPIHQTRRFPVDQDFMPRNTAPGGGSDLIFEFDSYVLVVEVTLTTSHRQMAVESEPVRRHTVQYKLSYPSKDVYCLFIAPSIDNNVAETFKIGIWYDGDEEEFVNIVPMQLSDFIITIETLKQKKFNNHTFKNLLDRCLIYRNVRAPQWIGEISKQVDAWKNRILAN